VYTDAPRRPRPTAGQRLLTAFVVFLVTALVVTAAGAVHGWFALRGVERLPLAAALDETGAGQPRNILLVGSDSREGGNPDGPVGAPPAVEGRRSDTIMVLRSDPATGASVLLSIPRDLHVPIAGTDRRQRINAAYSRSAETLVRTVQAALGIPVHHYAEVDFQAFQRLVDAAGGVPVWFDTPVRDGNTGLSITEPGCHVLDGTQALQFTRSRYLERFVDGAWQADGTGDLGRIERQQDFVARALLRSVERASSNPVVATDVLQAAVDNLTVDDRLDLVTLGTRLRSVGSLSTHTLPATPRTIDGQAVLVLDGDAAAPLLDVFAGRVAALPGTATDAPPPAADPQAPAPSGPAVPDPAAACR
jgi:polyisoprenyl-teichoic acid--peptidoglycan teichoic acid transferase